jgi:hypothetical protein
MLVFSGVFVFALTNVLVCTLQVAVLVQVFLDLFHQKDVNKKY